jgi:hypothetical protein
MQQLDGPRFDEVVALEEGQSLKKHFIFVYALLELISSIISSRRRIK